MEMLLNVATPLTADTVNVPDNVPLLGSLLIAKVILSVAVPTRFPPASSTRTSIAGEIETVESSLLGCTWYTNWVGDPTAISKLNDVASAKLPDVASKV